MESDTSKGVKRKTSPGGKAFGKRQRTDEDRSSSINILHFSDCVLLSILQWLDATSLYHFGLTCLRFKNLVEDPSLWVTVDARRPPQHLEKIDFCWQNVGKKTKRFLIAGARRTDFSVPLDKFVKSNELANLTVLALEHQCIKHCTLKHFPMSLQELSLRHSFIPDWGNFFRRNNDSTIAVNIKTLILDHCQWLESGCLAIIGKYPNLEILSLYMCKKLGEDDVSNVSLAGMLGFVKLKVIDLRFTSGGDLFIKSLYKHPTLQVIYMQGYSTTYRSEKLKRKLDFLNRKDARPGSYVSDDESNNDSSEASFYRRYNSLGGDLMYTRTQTLTDQSTVGFKNLRANADHREAPKSVLYVYPYGKCACGYYNGTTETYRPLRNRAKPFSSDGLDSSDSDESDEDWDYAAVARKLKIEKRKTKLDGIFFLSPGAYRMCGVIHKDSCILPDHFFKLFNPSAPEIRFLFTREPRNDYELSVYEHIHKHYSLRSFGTVAPCLFEPLQHRCDGAGQQGVIVLSWNEQGNLVSQRVAPTESQAENNAIPVNADDMKRLAEAMRDKSIEDILRFVDEFLINKFTIDLAEDEEFVEELAQLIANVVREVSFLEMVLESHIPCFKNLFFLMNRDILIDRPKKDVLKDRLDLLLRFFYNFYGAERRPFPLTDRSSEFHGLQICAKTYVKSKVEEKVSFTRSATLDPYSQESSNPETSITLSYLRSRCFERQMPLPIQLTNIRELSLRGYSVTDRTLHYLKELELDLLDVSSTKVTFGGLQEFMQSNPNCRVVHERACVCQPRLHF